MTHGTTRPDSEVWLRANTRPVSLLVAVALVTGTLLVAACGIAPVSRIAVPVAAAYWLVVGPIMAVTAISASRPRLARRGGSLQVRLKPLAVHEVPLEFVECFFMGSHVLADPHGRDDVATQRVGTLVMRIAERATDWQARPTLAPWGTWAEGAVVFDGRWCEPLSVDLARRLSARLVEAKRAIGESAA